MVNAHRLTYTLLFGIPVGSDMVLHRCGNAGCINPHHLYAGGDAENQRDKLLHELARCRGTAQEVCHETQGEHHSVSLPTPPLLSQEVSRAHTAFKGFSQDTCYFAEWLASTSDGFRQLPGRVLHGDVAGAHRKVFQLFNGPLGKLEIVTHTCGKEGCLNPHHLRVSGRHSDALAFDRLHDRRCKIDSNGRAAIADLRRTASEVARALGVHRQTVVAARADLRHSLRSGGSTR